MQFQSFVKRMPGMERWHRREMTRPRREELPGEVFVLLSLVVVAHRALGPEWNFGPG